MANMPQRMHTLSFLGDIAKKIPDISERTKISLTGDAFVVAELKGKIEDMPVNWLRIAGGPSNDTYVAPAVTFEEFRDAKRGLFSHCKSSMPGEVDLIPIQQKNLRSLGL